MVDAASLFASVPDGHDRDEVFDWAVGPLPFRDGAISDEVAQTVLEGLSWSRVLRSRRFWADDLASATRAACSTAAGWVHLGAPVGIVARNIGEGLDLRVGAPPGRVAGLLGALQGNFPGVQLGPTESLSLDPGCSSWFLCAVTDDAADPRAPALLDRLCELRGVQWQLEVLGIPVPTVLLRGRCVALAHLAVNLAAQRSTQRQVDPRTTETFEDPVVVHLEGSVGAELERVSRAYEQGCLAVFARLRSPDRATLPAALGAVTGAAPSAGTRWMTGPDEGALPLALVPASAAGDLVRLPARDIHGLPSERWVQLDEHPDPTEDDGPTIRLGRTDRDADLSLPLRRLTDHVAVTGGSGAGKSTFVTSVLLQLTDAGVPYLVLEPVKDEYRRLDLPGLRSWRPGAPDPGLDWALNPLEVPAGTPVATHTDRLVALFRSCFDLPDPLDHLVEIALGEVYADAGWDLGSDRNLLCGPGHETLDWPTLSDLLAVCSGLPARLGYDREIRGNLQAMIAARLGGLTRGPRGRVLDRNEPFPARAAFAEPLLVNLDAVGDDHARAFLMGLLLTIVREIRGSTPVDDLLHVTVVEEAHRVMGKSDTPAADPRDHVAEAFGDLLAEIRAVGEGVVIVEQSPRRLVRSAMVNTATKIALRSTDTDDQSALGAALGLDTEDSHVLATLRRHEGLVAWAGMDAPVLARLEAALLPRRELITEVSNRVPVRPSLWPAAVANAAAILVAADESDHRRARSALLDAISTHWPGAHPSVVDELFREAVIEQVAVLARARNWPRATRIAAGDAVLNRAFSAQHPRRLLEDSAQPHLACAKACPEGGCTTAELLAPQAAQIAAEGPATLVRLARDEQERGRRLRRRVDAVIPASAPRELHDHCTRCLTVQVFDEWADVATVSGLWTPSQEAGA